MIKRQLNLLIIVQKTSQNEKIDKIEYESLYYFY